MINSLFKSQAIMVEREEEYLPVITEKQEHSWESAYREYLAKKDKRSSHDDVFHSEIAEEAKIKAIQ